MTESDGDGYFFILNGSPYISAGDMDLVFLEHHLNSTDGNEVWGLDLATMTGAEISQNGAIFYHPPSAPGIFAVAAALYQPLGDTKMTVNCSYLEWWDAHLKMVRYGTDLSVFYSAAVYCGSSDKAIVIGESSVFP